MENARKKLPSVDLKDVTNFGDLCNALLRCVLSYTYKSTEVHLILENYKVISPKSSVQSHQSKVISPKSPERLRLTTSAKF